MPEAADRELAANAARGYYRLLYEEVRHGREHEREVDGEAATGRAMDRVLGLLRCEAGRWAQLASRLDFTYLLCSQASAQLLKMLDHAQRRAARSRRQQDAEAVGIAPQRALLSF